MHEHRAPHERAHGGMGPKPLTAEEIQRHPEYPHVHWKLKADSKGKIDVAAGRGGPFKLAYELHGHGPTKIVWIMGLGGFMKTWQRQTKDFGHSEADKYTCLVFDNRGMGESDKPILRYTTSEMAKDVVELLDHVGWKDERRCHVVGISMGGMISQELAMQIPERICSLNLISTAPRIVRTLPFMENIRNRINLMVPKSLDDQIAKVKADCYSAEWLAKADETEHVVEPFPSNGDRFAAQEIDKRLSPGVFTPRGFLCQLYAAGFHHKSDKQLKQMGDAVGRNRILVFHGTGDHMIDFVHGKMLLEGLGGEASGVTKSFHEGMGHVGPFEIRKEFHRLIVDRIEKTEALNKA
ncbi:Putative aminoacrylate hydrolase RutD [Fulvia fulva]|uniref:Aminoacrylate hydrolase RutD n=1 Tax=Passalora fulva TaxID=5499 RepID=A0A9Q8L5N0_PASFU|nr:Putative aminoacrylate hydrolase RutD [Fulvia fulva]KAK4634024.1 putative aminoacrylate hydrolase RutD [Fulvia fulva]KAK4637593.1 putative aminoacrylate hydrolase RutD [Fulvia fulva]UJO11335.1 Putative aminoacrylate hydrolase RutD [Fulvia fulva]WPV09656.1 Putative aminoacrylate hydrolase RutD [Fulvia fulva]WPV24867.1 Putative aminoacrylate hydrolase RutD [Fulvia fulva]